MKFCNEDFTLYEEENSRPYHLLEDHHPFFKSIASETHLRKDDTFDDLDTFLHYFEHKRTTHEDQEQCVEEEENTLSILVL